MPEIGQILAYYTLEEKIGRGGMGEVFPFEGSETWPRGSHKGPAGRVCAG
jgi:hypothetical protein